MQEGKHVRKSSVKAIEGAAGNVKKKKHGRCKESAFVIEDHVTADLFGENI